MSRHVAVGHATTRGRVQVNQNLIVDKPGLNFKRDGDGIEDGRFAVLGVARSMRVGSHGMRSEKHGVCLKLALPKEHRANWRRK